MQDMTDHAKPPARRDHLWVLFIIAACALLEVWASWLGIGSVSGFPKLGKMTTGWILPVTTEAYWGYAVWAWLAGAAGPRSRRFAMWTAIVMFTLSLGGQESGHLVAAAHRQAPSYAVAFVTALPLIAVGLIAILIHLRQADREEFAETERVREASERQAAVERAEADERTALRAELEAAHAAREAAESALEPLRAELAKAVAKAETLTRKLESATARKRPAATGRKPAAATARKQEPVTGPATAPETPSEETVDLDAEALVLKYLAEGMSASEAGRKAGLSDSRGRQIARKLAKTAPIDAVDGGESGEA